jgi:hypothetical protein
MVGRVVVAVGLCAVLIMAALTVSAQSDAAPELLIVMTDGRVIRGNAQGHAAGYLVDRTAGRMLVPHEQIRCVARNLPDAYRQQREAMVDPTAASLIQLAEWCISYRLYDEAADELRRALRRDPENDIARRMLARVQEQLLATPTKGLERPLSNREGLLTPEVESLGGLSREAASNFTTKIQPLLMNKCGNAACHGTEADNGFRLNMVRLGSANHRRSSELNLALVMKYVDMHEPHHSPLLENVRKGHGGAPATLFGGSSGPAQLKILSDWVQTVASERAAEEAKLAKRTPLKKAPKTAAVEVASAEKFEPSQAAVIPAVATREAVPVPHVLASATRPDDEAKSAAAKPIELPPKRRVDRFDPQEFNEKFGNTKSR